jgi:hypothetical protein
MLKLPFRKLVLPVIAIASIVVASNVLVQHPFDFYGLGDFLTWGAFTYPFAFLVNDLTNRRFGPTIARTVVASGFFVALSTSLLLMFFLSLDLGTFRIILASGTAFLVGQLFDITVFNRLRRQTWWRAPLIGSIIGSALDTALFFSLAFAGDPDMSGLVDVFGTPLPLWQSLAIFDFSVKMLVAFLALVPYGALMSSIMPMENAGAKAQG